MSRNLTDATCQHVVTSLQQSDRTLPFRLSDAENPRCSTGFAKLMPQERTNALKKRPFHRKSGSQTRQSHAWESSTGFYDRTSKNMSNTEVRGVHRHQGQKREQTSFRKFWISSLYISRWDVETVLSVSRTRSMMRVSGICIVKKTCLLKVLLSKFGRMHFSIYWKTCILLARLVSELASGKRLALKSLDKYNATSVQWFEQEVSILQILDHPSIVEFVNCFEVQYHVSLGTNFSSGLWIRLLTVS